jgi:hypothetical protein
MSADEKIRRAASLTRVHLLQGELNRIVLTITETQDDHRRFREDFPPVATERNYDLVILADILTDYYTCVETAFVRIAKTFENEIEERHWHKSLLERMTVEIPNVRVRAISDRTYRHLHELMRFRHFRRYYFNRRYDRERMSLLEKSFLESIPMVRTDLTNFSAFLEDLAGRIGRGTR